MYLIDTNVISEARKGKQANPGVQKFFRSTDAADLYICVQTIGEIRRGLENIRHRNDLTQARKLERWLDLVVADYVNRTLSFDEACAQVWGRLMSPHHAHPVDKQIAAIALIYDLTVVTRNVDDFRATGVALKNPFVECGRGNTQNSKVDAAIQAFRPASRASARDWCRQPRALNNFVYSVSQLLRKLTVATSGTGAQVRTCR